MPRRSRRSATKTRCRRRNSWSVRPCCWQEVADIGAHVAGTRDGRTFLRSAPPIACIPPPNPKRPGTVPIAQLHAGIAALLAVNEGRLDGERKLAAWVEKCHIVGD